MRQAPTVSVVVPVRNEVEHIEACIRALMTQEDCPVGYEILGIDGMSDDGTREIVMALGAEDHRVRLLDNPAQIVPTALNIGVSRSSGAVIIRVDGHTTVAPDFVRQNLALFDEHPEAWSVGGPIVHRGKTPTARAIAAAMSSPVGVGGARHRFEHYEGYAEGTAFPAFRRWIFDRVGLFDEDLVRNQDDEFNFRITRAGGRIFISPRVKHDYFVRGSYRALFTQYLQYAYWKVVVMRKHGAVIAPRHLVPGVFVLALPVCTGAALLLPFPLSLAGATPLVAYGTLLASLVVRTTVAERSLTVGVGAAAAATTMHVAYGLGLLAGIAIPHHHGPPGPIARLMTRLTR